MNPDMYAASASISGASGGLTGANRAHEPANTGQRPSRSPVGQSSQSAGDETGRFEKKQRKRARRRKNGKGSVAEKNHVITISHAAPHTEDASARQISAEQKQPVKSGEQKPTKKLSNRRRRARRKKQAPDAQTLIVSTANPTTATNGPAEQAAHPAHLDEQRGVSARAPLNQRSSTPERSGAPHQSHDHNRQAHGVSISAQTNEAVRAQAARVATRSHHHEMPLYAALDLGTNNCRLLIATPGRSGQFRVVDSFSRIVRLGEGFGTSGHLSDQAMQRAIEALKICRDKLANKNIRRMRLIATEACRSAQNGTYFLQRVREEAGLDLEIVDRQTEASLAVSGCGTLVKRDTDALVLFDIGGGSSEIALIDVTNRRSSRLAEHITAWTSLPVGVVTLAEKFGGRDVTPENYAEMVNHVSQLLNDFSDRHKLGDLAKGGRFHLLGTSGTVTTLAGIHLGLERYDRRKVDGMWMESDDVTQMTEKLLSWDFTARVANPCIGADRADLVLAGCAILDAIRIIWPSEKLLVADRGLREGILTELMSRDGAWRPRRGNHLKGRHT